MELQPILRAAVQQHWETSRSEASSLPGVVLVASRPDDEAIATSGLAVVEHRIELGEHSRLYAASLAKIVTALCVHRLVARGQIDLDAPVATLLSDLSLPRGITMRTLLLHRSGLPEYHALRLVAGHEVEDRLVPDDVRRLAGNMTTWFEPGAKVSYNNTNYALAAMIVGEVVGMPFDRAATELVFEPAGMFDALVRGNPGEVFDGMCAGYTGGSRHLERAMTASTSIGDGGMWWSGHDLAALGRALLRSGLPLTSDPVGPIDDSVDRLRQQVPLADGALPALATGCTISPDGAWFGGLAEFVGFKAELRVYPDHGVAIGAMSNHQSAGVTALLDSLAADLELPVPAEAAIGPPRSGPTPLGPFVGVGGAAWRFDAVTPGDERRVVRIGDLRFHVRPEGPQWQVEEQPDVVVAWEADDELVVRDAGREVARLRRVGGPTPEPTTLPQLAGWWWCEAAAATVVIRHGTGGLSIQRGQLAREPLEPIGARDGSWIFAAPWGLVVLRQDGRGGHLVLHRAERLDLVRLDLSRS